MKFVDASYEIINIPSANNNIPMDVYKHLERIGRIPYKSEDKITDESCIKYLKMIRDCKHWAMLEHFVFVMRVSKDIYIDYLETEFKHPDDFMLHEKLKYINFTKDIEGNDDTYLVSGSATSFNYIWECPSMMEYEKTPGTKHGLVKICNLLNRLFPEIMKIPVEKYDDCGFLGMSKIEFLSREEIEDLPFNLREIHDTMSVKFVTNLGVSHDIVRSRPVSYAMESTRWINYSKKCGFTCTIPLWFSDEEKKYLLEANENVLDNIFKGQYTPLVLSENTSRWIHHLKNVEDFYNYFSKDLGYKNDQTSLLLPKNYKTELVVTTRIVEWKHIFFLRCQNDVRPDMRKIIVPLVKECIDTDAIWADQYPLYEKVEKNNG